MGKTNQSLDNALYSRGISNALEVFILDDVVVKNKHGKNEDVTPTMSRDRIINLDSIGIQAGKQVIVYCDEQTSKIIQNNPILSEMEKSSYERTSIRFEDMERYDETSKIKIETDKEITYWF